VSQQTLIYYFTLCLLNPSTGKDIDGKITSSGVQVDLDLLADELQIDIGSDKLFNWELDQFVDSGKHQINLT
jgi:hypothetical protein